MNSLEKYLENKIFLIENDLDLIFTKEGKTKNLTEWYFFEALKLYEKRNKQYSQWFSKYNEAIKSRDRVRQNKYIVYKHLLDKYKEQLQLRMWRWEYNE